MQRTFEHTVGDSVYQITTFPALKGMAILQRLLKVFGPSVGELIGGLDVTQDVKLDELVIDGGVFSRALTLFVENLDKADVATLAKDMCDGLLMNGQPVQFNQHFAGNYGHLISVLTAIVKENYSSFFDGSGFGGLQALIPRNAPPSKSE